MFRRRLPVIQDIGAEIARLLMSSCRQAVNIAPRPDCRRHRAPFIEANSAQDEAISSAPNWIGCWRSGARVTPWSCTAWTGWRATSMTCGPPRSASSFEENWIPSEPGNPWTKRPPPSCRHDPSQRSCVGTGRLRVRLTERALGLEQRASATSSSHSDRALETALDCASDRASLRAATRSGHP